MTQRPAEPAKNDVIWYRNWECWYVSEAGYWGVGPWVAYKGGADVDAPQVSSKTWTELLDEIDVEEDDD